MTNLHQRLLLFVVAIPGLLALILFLPGFNYLAFNILVLLCALGLAFESAMVVGLFPDTQSSGTLHKSLRMAGIVILGSAGPLCAFLFTQGVLGPGWFPLIGTVLILGVFITQVIRTQTSSLDDTLHRVLSYVFILIYPGLGFAYLGAITTLNEANWLLLLFLGAVFGNDSAAYVFGFLFGRWSSHPVKVSPKKTMIGFLGGLLAGIGAFALTAALRPQLFPAGMGSAIILGAVVAVVVILGDLFESALKRSAHLKDSGNIIPGRGGLLDSLDSLVFAAPIFYYGYLLSQHPTVLFP